MLSQLRRRLERPLHINPLELLILLACGFGAGALIGASIYFEMARRLMQANGC